MKSQRKAREVALQILFQNSFHETANAEELFNSFVDNFQFGPETTEYARFLTEAVLSEQEKINRVIGEHSENWRLDRMAVIDKILLQIAIYELCFMENRETAPKLCIIDILDLAKKYSSEESKNFINGILDKVYHQKFEQA